MRNGVTGMKVRLLRLLVVLSVLTGSVAIVQSPAYAMCQTVSFTFYGIGSWSCSGEYRPSGTASGYRSTGWGGSFVYRAVEPLCCGVWTERKFCDWQDVTFPTQWDGENGVWRQIRVEIDFLYLSPTRPSWC